MLQMEADMTLCLVLFLVRAPTWDASDVEGTRPAISLTVQAHKVEEVTFMGFHLVLYFPIFGHHTLKRLPLLNMCFVLQREAVVEKVRRNMLSSPGWLAGCSG